MTYERAAKAAYSVFIATGNDDAKELSNFFARQLPQGKLDHVERVMLERVLK